MSFAIDFRDHPGNARLATVGHPRVRRANGGPNRRFAPTMSATRQLVVRWLAAGRWVEFSSGGDLPSHWDAGSAELRCDNCGAPDSSPCNMWCPERRLTSVPQCLAVQVPCDAHDHHRAGAGGEDHPDCVDGLVTVAWATNEFGPLQVVGHRYRLRRSKPNQFELSDGTFHDVTPDIEPICLPGRWARGGSISAIPGVSVPTLGSDPRRRADRMQLT